jgi:hypothetical protein
LLRNAIVRRFCLIVCLAVSSLGFEALGAETFRMSNGETITGELLLSSAKDEGIQIKVDEGKYERVPWASFSQEDLKRLAQNPKLQPLVEPFIEISQEQRIKKTEVRIEQPPRLDRPPKQFLLGALFSSGLGVFVMVLLYAANIYAGYEISIFRARPPAVVCGVSAILPIIGPILFLALPTQLKPSAETFEAAPAETVGTAQDEVNPMLADGAAHPTSLKLHSEPEQQKSNLPETATFQRGQFTFNRRFFETRFPGFFGVVKREADKDMVLVIKAARGSYVGQRISRIAANDLHIQVQKGPATEEIMIPFSEIQEIQLKHKNA